MQVYFDSREAKFKTPFGSVKPSTEVFLTIDMWDGEPSEAYLIVLPEGQEEERIKMEIFSRPGGYTAKCVLIPQKAQLLWYSFELIDSEGYQFFYGPQDNRVGGIGQVTTAPKNNYQLTVSEMDALPDWYKNSIVYQIFPDRFAREEGVSTESLTSKLVGHENGPKRQIVDWDFPLRYDRNEDNSIKTWDFYGGSIKGIIEKLDYLEGLGITCIYLNPIFEAASNHRYDTGDYERIDVLLGLEEDFQQLCATAKERGINIILDGVFNHTGCDSKYFNKYDNYPDKGAYGNKDSHYYPWYTFTDKGYECWWGVKDLPQVDENNEEYQQYICNVVRKWLALGAKGFRLDVADELPDSFIALLRKSIKEEDPEAVLLGEVWEDASNKISYGTRREYFLGKELDSVMNYPFTDGLLAFLTNKINARDFSETLETLYENYPYEAFCGNLNLLGSHDRVRVLTCLGDAPHEDAMTEKERGEYVLSPEQMKVAKTRYWLANVVQMTMLGVPCIYYGDEAGLTGYTDPYNRAPFPWGNEDEDCQKIVRELIELRNIHPIFREGSLEVLDLGDKILGYTRRLDGEFAVVLVNSDMKEWHQAYLPKYTKRAFEMLGHAYWENRDNDIYVSLPPMSASIVYFGKEDAIGKIPEEGKGVLCHVTSLPTGVFGKTCIDFLQKLKDKGYKYWQILPLNPTDAGGSPYAGSSAMAGNLKLTGLDEADLYVQYKEFVPDTDYAEFIEKNKYWLNTYAMYQALKEYYLDAHWWEWKQEHQIYSDDLWKNDVLSKEAKFQIYCQYVFSKLWQDVRDKAAELGISIIGDLPMYVAADSADCWAHSECFALENGRIVKESGAPPDYFDPKGQLWGSPVFNWKALEKQDYSWWLDRFQRAFELYDYVRLDHFRGFAAYWETEAGELPTTGKWVPGPGLKLFEKAYEKFGKLPIIAEDLGKITPSVRLLLKTCGFYGMDVMQFANKDPRTDDYNPGVETIAYTGTHDNATLLGWCLEGFKNKAEAEKLGKDIDVALSVETNDTAKDDEIFAKAKMQSKEMLTKLWASDAPIKIVPLQDLLGLGNEARMNTPGTLVGNWSWQAEKLEF